MVNVLFVTSKDPSPHGDNDGGARTTREVIQQLGLAGTRRTSSLQWNLLILRPVSDDVIPWARRYGMRDYRTLDQAPQKKDPEGPTNKFQSRIEESDAIAALIRQLVNDWRIDLVLTQHAANAFGLAQTLGDDVKLVILPMFTSVSYQKSGDSPPQEYRELEQQSINRADCIITPSRAEQRILVGLGATEGAIRVVERGVSIREFHRGPRRAPRPGMIPLRLISVGAVRPQKNFQAALRTLNVLRHMRPELDARLTIVGGIQDSRYDRIVQSLAKDLPVQRYVVWTGNQPQRVAAALMRDSHVGLVQAKEETFGRAATEGLATGLPSVIFDDLTAVTEHLQINEGVSLVGRPFDPDDEGELLARAILDILTDDYDQRVMAAHYAVDRSVLRERTGTEIVDAALDS